MIRAGSEWSIVHKEVLFKVITTVSDNEYSNGPIS